MCMAFMDNLTTISYGENEIIQFSSEGYMGLDYHKFSSKESNKLCDDKILEYDIDVMQDGCIGVIILNDKSNLLYFYYDKNNWTKHLLYKPDKDFEEIKHINIKFCNGSPYIIFCWRSFQNPNSWSVVNYFLSDCSWKKEIMNTLFLKDNIKPYAITKDCDSNLHLVFITNNNLIYNLFIKTLSSKTSKWSNSFYLSECIYIKIFDIDVIADLNDRIHISWIDKNRSNYCIKYTFYDINSPKSEDTGSILISKKTYKKQQLIIQDDCLVCYGITDDYIHYATKKLLNCANVLWEKHNTVFSSHSIHLVKIAQAFKNPYIAYIANIILSENISKPKPIILEEIIAKHQEQYNENISMLNFKGAKGDIIPEGSTDKCPSNLGKENISEDSIKKIKGELLKKQQELHGKDNIIHVLEGKISFFANENKRILELNKKYLLIINENSERINTYKNKLLDQEERYDNKIKNFEFLAAKNEELMSVIESQRLELTKLQEQIDNFKNASLLKKLFGS